MDQMKNTINLQNYPTMNQTSFVSIREDDSTCLKHLGGYASPKLTPKHTRSVKQSKRRTKTHESPQLEFPPPPSFPPPEHYDLSDEYSADLIDRDVSNCKTHHRLNEGLVRYRTVGDDQPPEGFWNSPVEAPWSYFLGDVNKNLDEVKSNEKWVSDGRTSKKESNLNKPNEFWDVQAREEGWICKDVESSTPYMERKFKVKKKSKKSKMTEEADHVSEEAMLINKLKEEFGAEEKNLKEVQDFRSEIWVSAAPSNEGETVFTDKNTDNSCIQIKKNHISNVLITHGNDEILDNFIENKPIHKESGNGPEDEKYEVHLINNYAGNDNNDVRPDVACEKCIPNENFKNNFIKENKVTVVSGDFNRQEYRLNKNKNNYSQGYPVGNTSLSGDSPDEYSYAYYEPGPASRVTVGQDAKKYGPGRNSRYTYTTRYGTEENIYEEITEVSCNLKGCFSDDRGQRVFERQPRHFHHGSFDSGKTHEGGYIGNGTKSQSQLSLNQSIVEEEVREVQSTHRRVLGQLNLTMEEMLMPNLMKEKDEIKEDAGLKKMDLLDDNQVNQITDLDSGFSGSSGTSVSFYGVANYTRSTALFRRPDLPRSPLANNCKNYPVMPFKSKQYSDMSDYRLRGCCGNRCCSEKFQYQCNGRTKLGELS